MVPKGWDITTLGEHVTITSGYSPSKYNLNESGSYPFVKVEDMNNCTKYQLLSRTYTELRGNPTSKNAVIFPKRGAAIMNNKVRIAEAKMYLDTNMMALTPKKSVCSEFLYYTLVREELHKIADTSTIPQINNKHILPYRFKLPPFPEQRKIAKILSTWDKAIATTEKLIATSKQQKKALMQQLLTGKKRLCSSPKDGAETGVAFEGEWDEVKVSQLGTIVSGGTPSTEIKNYWNGDIHWVTPTDITKLTTRKITKTARTITEQGLKNSSAKLVPLGSLLVCTRATIGKMAISEGEMCTNQGFKNLIPNKKTNVEFLYYLMSCEKHKLLSKASGSTFLELSKKDFESILFMVPKFKEQQKIASVLTAADKEIELLQTKLSHFKQEKKALMQQLLTGKRRVMVDQDQTPTPLLLTGKCRVKTEHMEVIN